VLLTLSVISENAAQLGLQGYKVFDERGGDIGRLETSHWMLRDPDYLVSARHARIFFNQREFCLEDTSTNGTFVNAPDHPAPREGALPLHDGDRLFIGSFEILVQVIEELPVIVAQGSTTVELPALSLADAAALTDYDEVPADQDQDGAPAAAVPIDRERQLENVARIGIAGAMDALRSRDEALHSLGIPVSGPHAPTLDPISHWPPDVDHALRALVDEDSAGALSIETLAEAFGEIGMHQGATAVAVRSACDSLFARLSLDRNTDRHLRALFANELARTYAEQLYELRATREQP
jgi:predicted component of type VI protein secretion system